MAGHDITLLTPADMQNEHCHGTTTSQLDSLFVRFGVAILGTAATDGRWKRPHVFDSIEKNACRQLHTGPDLLMQDGSIVTT